MSYFNGPREIKNGIPNNQRWNSATFPIGACCCLLPLLLFGNCAISQPLLIGHCPLCQLRSNQVKVQELALTSPILNNTSSSVPQLKLSTRLVKTTSCRLAQALQWSNAFKRDKSAQVERHTDCFTYPTQQQQQLLLCQPSPTQMTLPLVTSNRRRYYNRHRRRPDIVNSGTISTICSSKIKSMTTIATVFTYCYSVPDKFFPPSQCRLHQVSR